MESNQSNAAALRAFRVLDHVASHQDGCSAAQLVTALALPKQTVHRIIAQLQLAGLLIREPGTRRVQLGARLTRFAENVLIHGQASRERHAILKALVDDIGETCNLTALAGTDIVYLDRVETAWPLRVMLAPGSHVPLHATATGKLLLSLLPKSQRERLLRVLPLRPMTTATIVDVKSLRRELEETRSRRIGINRNEHLSGLIAVAVPVMLDRQRACAAVAVQAPVGRMNLDDLLAFVPRMREAAVQIAGTLRN
ncbi:MAG: IclR family transcriptional regulator [Gemmatimonadota bacterium]